MKLPDVPFNYGGMLLYPFSWLAKAGIYPPLPNKSEWATMSQQQKHEWVAKMAEIKLP